MTVLLSGRCGELVEEQEAIIARWQVAGSMRDLAGIDTLLRQGKWQTLYRGVYAAHNTSPARPSQLWAAVLRCGPGAALSHGTAAELDGITGQSGDAIHVTIPAPGQVKFGQHEFSSGRPRIIVHRSRRIEDARHPAKSLPRTRVEDTVLDLVDSAGEFEQAFNWLSAACQRRRTTPAMLRDAIGQRERLRWRSEALGALDEVADGVTSGLERRYVRAVERPHGLPKPERQAKRRRGAASAYLDNLYEEFALAVELDGLASHPPESRWQDIHRDNYFARSGICTLRYNWSDVTRRPCEVASEIAFVLRQRGWTGQWHSCGRSCRPLRLDQPMSR
jgi:hypothetical protein